MDDFNQKLGGPEISGEINGVYSHQNDGERASSGGVLSGKRNYIDKDEPIRISGFQNFGFGGGTPFVIG